MIRRIPRSGLMVAALAGATIAALCVAAGYARAAPTDTRELSTSPGEAQAVFEPLVAGNGYRAGLIQPSPSIRAPVRGWLGTQWVSHQGGKVRYETAALLWHDYSGREVDIISGPAMTLSPAGALAQPRSRIPHWNFAPYSQPTSVRRWTIAGRLALYFDATAPPPGVWTLIGSSPPELQIEHDNAFRMTALTVRGRTLVIVIRAPAPAFAQFLPVAEQLVAALTFPTS